MPTRATLQSAAARRVGGLDVPDWSGFIEDALRDLDAARPRFVLYELTGDGTNDYALPSASGYEDGFSVFDQLRGVRRVADDDWTKEPVYVRGPYEVAAGDPTNPPRLHLDFAPPSTEKIALRFSARNVCDGSTCTVEDRDLSAVADLVAAYALEDEALELTRTREQSVDADLSLGDFAGRGSAIERRAEMLRQRFEIHFGLRQRSGAGATADSGAPAVSHVVPERRPGIRRYRHTHG